MYLSFLFSPIFFVLIQKPIRIPTFPFRHSNHVRATESNDLTNVLGDATGGPRVLRELGPRSRYYRSTRSLR